MKAHIKQEKATIDGQVFEAPGIRDGWHEVEIEDQYKNLITNEWVYDCDPKVTAMLGFDTRQILVKQEGEEKAEMILSIYLA